MAPLSVCLLSTTHITATTTTTNTNTTTNTTMSWETFERVSGVMSFCWTWISPVLVSFGPGKDWVQYFFPSLWPPKKVQPTQSDPESHEMGERRSQLLSDLEVTIGKVQTIAPLFEAQRQAQEKSLSDLSTKLATTDANLREVARSLEVQLAELQRLEADIRDQAVAVGSREVEARNREAALEAKFCNHVLVPICDIDEVFEVAGEVSRKVCSIRDGL